MINKIELLKVKYLPNDLEPGILYFSKKYGVAGHLCPCGCGSKIITPFGKNEWEININKDKPTLFPSMGNWQLPCRSHYWIINGKIEWSYQWSEEEIIDGRNAEDKRRKLYYDKIIHKHQKWSVISNLIKYFKA